MYVALDFKANNVFRTIVKGALSSVKRDRAQSKESYAQSKETDISCDLKANDTPLSRIYEKSPAHSKGASEYICTNMCVCVYIYIYICIYIYI